MFVRSDWLARGGTPGDDWRYVSMPFPIHDAGALSTGAFRPAVACKEDAICFALPPL
jgi:hypothetical protein